MKAGGSKSGRKRHRHAGTGCCFARDAHTVIHRNTRGSAADLEMLRQQGFKDVKSMAGGILLWNKDVNPGGPQY